MIPRTLRPLNRQVGPEIERQAESVESWIRVSFDAQELGARLRKRSKVGKRVRELELDEKLDGCGRSLKTSRRVIRHVNETELAEYKALWEEEKAMKGSRESRDRAKALAMNEEAVKTVARGF